MNSTRFAGDPMNNYSWFMHRYARLAPVHKSLAAFGTRAHYRRDPYPFHRSPVRGMRS